MRFTMRQPAGPGTVLAPDAFADQLGQLVPVTVDGKTIGRARLVAADVAADGRSVTLTMESDQPLSEVQDVSPAVS